jgi:hypothetical protein
MTAFLEMLLATDSAQPKQTDFDCPHPSPSGPAKHAGRSDGPRGNAAQSDRLHPPQAGEGAASLAVALKEMPLDPAFAFASFFP